MKGKAPTESHNVKQIGLGFGHQGSNYLQFQFRPGLHDITDFQRGYLDSSELVILDTQVRWQNQKLTIREINLASLSLMRPTTFREKSFSWKTQWNYFNQSQIFCNFCRSIYGEASIGLAQNFFTNQMLYFLFGGFVQPQNLGTNEMNGGGFAEFGSIARFGEKIRFITSIKFYQNMLNVNKVSRLDLFSAGLHWNPVKDIDLNLTSKSGIVVHGSQHYRADATLSVDYHY